MTLALLFACAPPTREAVDPTLDAVALLARASLDIRGQRPTEAEILAVEADETALPGLLDTFVASDAFPERLVPLYNEVLRTRADRFLVNLDSDASLQDGTENLAFRHAMGEEPLRHLWYVADQDLPYTALVTADHTLANDTMFAHLPLEDLDGGTGWRRARYPDDRPPVGILAASGFYWRYTSTYENANRGRAAAWARALLCDNRYEAAVSFQGGVESLTDRTRTDPTCTSCHASLDPLASHFWGFMWRNQEAWLEAVSYDSNGEEAWQETIGVSPGYYGAPSAGLATLGHTIAADPRFVGCAVETAMRFLLREGVDLVSVDSFQAHREAFLDGGLRLRPLYRSILDDPAYRAVDDGAARTRPRVMRPDQLAASVEALTGYRWTWGSNDMLDVDDPGVRILAGGVDGFVASEAAPEPSTTTLLVQERVAEAAAAWAVATEGALDSSARTLLRELDPGDPTPDPGELTAQIQALYLRIHSRRRGAGDPDVTSLVALWQARLDTTGDPADAWETVIAALLRHPDFLFY
jgi:hypothetical protein